MKEYERISVHSFSKLADTIVENERFVGKKVDIEDFVLINARVHAGDNVRIGSRTTFDIRTKLGNGVQIGNSVEFIASGEQEVYIADGTRVFTRAMIHAGVTVGRDCTIAEGARLLRGAEIGNSVIIGAYSEIGEGVIVGDDTKIQSYAFIPMHSRIGNHAYIGPGVILTNTRHPRCERVWDCIPSQGVTLEDYAKIGAGATLAPGITIGENALLALGSTARTDIPPGEVWAGTPAVYIQKTKDLKCRTGVLGRNPYGGEDAS